MKKLTLDYINENAKNNPAEFVQLGEENYAKQITHVARTVEERLHDSPIILINGPSSSGKTTTSKRIQAQMERDGVGCHTISMDDYYLTRSSIRMPLDENGKEDLESPLCMDLPLLAEHLYKLTRGEEIQVPTYDFVTRSRTEEVNAFHLAKGEAVVIEGLHALNVEIVKPLGDLAPGVYISVASEVEISDDQILDGHDLRFVRRAIRDYNFRGSPMARTLNMWDSVKRGERLYISPYRKNAQIHINSFMPYETCVLMNQLKDLFRPYEREAEQVGVLEVFETMDQFEPIDYEKWMPENSFLHEFIG